MPEGLWLEKVAEFLNTPVAGSVCWLMNATFCRMVLAGLVSCLGVSCTTAYDAYGRPLQVVDPAVAVLGAAAVGALAYGLATSDDHDHRHYRSRHYRSYDRGYYRPSRYYDPSCHPNYRSYGHSRHRYY
jgi:hypothetical protein